MVPRPDPQTYSGYLGLDTLLSLQKLSSKPRQHDEVLFIIAHQAYELWFKLMLNELESAISSMIAGDVPEATRLIRRVVAVQKVLIEQLEVLETIRPKDFLKFRSILKPASGFQSLQFRELEFISGAKDKKFLRLHSRDEDSHEQLMKRWEGPSLWDGFLAVLERKGFIGGGKEGPASEAFRTQVAAITSLFTKGRHPEVVELAETLMDYDKEFWLWRNHHIAMVERVIGRKEGTGKQMVDETVGPYAFDSSGVSYLQTTLARRFFPALWAARTKIGEQ